MAKVASNLTRIYYGASHVSGDLSAGDFAVEQELTVVTCLSDTGPRVIAGNFATTHNDSGFFEGTTVTGLDPVAHGMIGGAPVSRAACPIGTDEGSPVYESLVSVSGKPATWAVGAAVLLNISATGADDVYRGTIIRSGAVAAAAAGTGRNMGASTSGQVFAVTYRVVEVTGSGSVTFQIQESSDNAAGDAYATISGMTETMTAVGVARDETTAATEAWKRVNVSAFSGFSTITVLITAGIVAGT